MLGGCTGQLGGDFPLNPSFSLCCSFHIPCAGYLCCDTELPARRCCGAGRRRWRITLAGWESLRKTPSRERIVLYLSGLKRVVDLYQARPCSLPLCWRILNAEHHSPRLSRPCFRTGPGCRDTASIARSTRCLGIWIVRGRVYIDSIHCRDLQQTNVLTECPRRML